MVLVAFPLCITRTKPKGLLVLYAGHVKESDGSLEKEMVIVYGLVCISFSLYHIFHGHICLDA